MDFRGIVLSEGFSWWTPLRLRSEDGRRVSFGKRPMQKSINQTSLDSYKIIISDQLNDLFGQI
jgi:hypothetical protein